MDDVEKVNKQLKRTRTMVFVLVTVCVLLTLFSFIQRAEADNQRNEVTAMRVQAEQQKEMDFIAKQELEEQQIRLTQQLYETLQALEACTESKK